MIIKKPAAVDKIIVLAASNLRLAAIAEIIDGVARLEQLVERQLECV